MANKRLPRPQEDILKDAQAMMGVAWVKRQEALRNPCVALFGHGPAAKACVSCKYLVKSRCELRPGGAEIKYEAHFAACAKYEER